MGRTLSCALPLAMAAPSSSSRPRRPRGCRRDSYRPPRRRRCFGIYRRPQLSTRPPRLYARARIFRRIPLRRNGTEGPLSPPEGRARERQSGAGREAASAIFRRGHYHYPGEGVSGHLSGSRQGFVYDAKTMKFILQLHLFRRRLGARARCHPRACPERRNQQRCGSSSRRDFRSAAS